MSEPTRIAAREISRIGDYRFTDAVCYERAAQIIRALAEAGYVIVPREPNGEQRKAVRAISTGNWVVARDYWRAMVKAALK